VPEEAAGEATAKKKSKSAPSLEHFFGKRPAAMGGEAEAVLAEARAAVDEINSVPATMMEAAVEIGAPDERMSAQEEGQPADDANPVLEFPLTQLLEAADFA